MSLNNLYDVCRLCPRDCNVNRNAGETGYCGENSQLRFGYAGLHSGEEPPLKGTNGSGTIFVSGCNLRCYFCQNWQVSGGVSNKNVLGRVVSTEDFISICLELQEKGAANINFVTGSHVVPAIIQNLEAAKKSGLKIPILWNSSAYENIKTLELLDGIVDIWLPDLKTLDSVLAEKIFNAGDYPKIASEAILWMIKNKPGMVFIRHLIFPGFLESTRTVLHWFAENAAGGQISVMTQYTPINIPGGNNTLMPERYVNEQEYETVIGWLEEFGIEEGFCQELDTGSDWLPDFNRKNPYSSELSVPVWHYSC